MVMLDQIREKVVVALIALFLGFALYTALGLAWSFKLMVEAPQRVLRHR